MCSNYVVNEQPSLLTSIVSVFYGLQKNLLQYTVNHSFVGKYFANSKDAASQYWRHSQARPMSHYTELKNRTLTLRRFYARQGPDFSLYDNYKLAKNQF